MGKMTRNRNRPTEPEQTAPDTPKDDLGLPVGWREAMADGLAKATPCAQDYVCRVDFNDAVRKQEADGTRLAIDATIAHYGALDDRPGMIADDALARLRALARERGAREWDALDLFD